MTTAKALKRISSILFFFFLIFNVQLSAQQELPLLPIDPQVRYGKLENGLTYYIRHNEQPKERANFYIAQRVGSILEEENQRGLAHFLEHMAFNGSKNFPDKAMDRYVESVGMRTGENLNAYTGFDETVYMIMEAPVVRQGVVDSCLLMLHDWSGFLSLTDSMIEKERGVIREEWRTSQDAQARLWQQQLPNMYPGSRYSNRMPIGTIDVINNFEPDELRDYYHKWYRPDLQALIIVGDIDVDGVEASIKKMFADIPVPVNAPVREEFAVPDNKEPLISIVTDKEASNTIVYLFHKYDKISREDYATIGGLLNDYIQSIIGIIMNERFEELIHQADPPFIYADASGGDYMIARTKAALTVSALAKEGEIESALTTLVNETERVKQYGFTASEYERARINLLKIVESNYNERDNHSNQSYASEYLRHFTEGGYIPGDDVEYTLFNQIAAGITVNEINGYVREMIGEENVVIGLTGPDKEGVTYPSEKELLQMFVNAKAMPVDAYVETVSDEPLIPELPAPGKIVDTIEDPVFDATVHTLSNGIKVILKHTKIKVDEVMMTATSPGGTTLFGDEDIENRKVINNVVSLGGIGNLSAVDLTKRLAGKTVSCSATMAPDNESLNGYAALSDVETLFELIYLSFTAPRMDEEAYASFVTRVKAQFDNLELNPMVAFSDSLSYAVYGDNPRAMRLVAKDFDRINYSRVMEMYKERFADASDFVFTFVGNIDKQAMRPLIEQYLATLPSLGRKEKGNVYNFPDSRKGRYVNHFQRRMETPKTSVTNIYTGEMDYNLENNITSTMLKQILDLVYTEKIREDEGGSYGVGVSEDILMFPEGSTSLQIFFDTDPAKWKQMNDIVHQEIKRITEEGPREEDFVKTQQNMLKRFAERQNENSYWLNVIDVYYSKGFDAFTHYEETLKGITPEKIKAFANQLIEQGNAAEIVMEPLEE